MALKQWAQKQHPPVVLDTDTDRRASQDSNDNRRPLVMRGKRRSKQARRMRLMSMYSEEMDSGGGGGGGGGQPVQNGTATNDYTKRPPSSNGQLTSPAEKRTSVISEPTKAPSKLSGTDIAELSLTDLPWGARWLEFVEGVSIVGLRYAVDPQAGNVRRLVWGMFILLGVGFMIYQIFERSVSVTQNLYHGGKLT